MIKLAIVAVVLWVTISMIYDLGYESGYMDSYADMQRGKVIAQAERALWDGDDWCR